jgi:hypothetical protein
MFWDGAKNLLGKPSGQPGAAVPTLFGFLEAKS